MRNSERNRVRAGTGAALVLTALVALGFFAGCRGKDTTRRQARETPSLRVALLTPGPISDDGWNASAYEGLLLIEKDLRAEVAHKESTNEGEFKQDFRDFARRGYDLIFAHGYEYSTHARDVASEFPQTHFVTTGGEEAFARRNYAPVVFVLDDAMYLLGVLAGKVTQTGVVGVVGGAELPPVVAAFRAFAAGVKSVRPEVRVLSSYVGGLQPWSDAARAREQAAAQIQQGADLLLQNADKAGLGVFQAVREARQKGANVYAFGSNRDQNHLAPTVILASAVSDIPEAFLGLARDVQAGTFPGRLVRFRLRDGRVRIVYNAALLSAVPAGAQEAVEAARQAFMQGGADYRPY
jgi:basic membrane lipoprotein Med (substrate-binding protein (PBP1-ABC) superfamily)